jgi:glycosyltransferase involved in cell wall biosynthesis
MSAGRKKKVLFISHDAHRHGAEILFLHFLQWFKANTGIPFHILLKNGGELRGEFEELAPVDVLGEKPIEQLLQDLRRLDAGLVYSNTFTNGALLNALSLLHCTVATHVHEMDYWIHYRTGRENNEQVLRHTDHYIACSHAVKQNLVNNLKVPSNRVDVIHGFVPTQSYAPDSFRARYARYRIRKQLRLPENAAIIGSAGTIDWRKGADLFVQLAHQVHKLDERVRAQFVWVGGADTGPEWGALMHDAARMGLEENVHFTGSHANPLDYFQLFDVFALMSREDPYPLVNLEAAALGKPILCFDKSGGSPEFVEDDCGFIVPYLNVEAMATRAIELLYSPALRERLGNRAREKVKERHDIEVSAPLVARLIEKLIRKKT